MSDPSTYREPAERAWVWVLIRVRRDDAGFGAEGDAELRCYRLDRVDGDAASAAARIRQTSGSGRDVVSGGADAPVIAPRSRSVPDTCRPGPASA